MRNLLSSLVLIIFAVSPAYSNGDKIEPQAGHTNPGDQKFCDRQSNGKYSCYILTDYTDRFGFANPVSKITSVLLYFADNPQYPNQGSYGHLVRPLGFERAGISANLNPKVMVGPMWIHLEDIPAGTYFTYYTIVYKDRNNASHTQRYDLQAVTVP